MMTISELVQLLLTPNFSLERTTPEIREFCRQILNDRVLFNQALESLSVSIKDTELRFYLTPRRYAENEEDRGTEFLLRALLNDPSETEWSLEQIRDFGPPPANPIVPSFKALAKTRSIQKLGVNCLDRSGEISAAISENETITSLTATPSIFDMIHFVKLGTLTHIDLGWQSIRTDFSRQKELFQTFVNAAIQFQVLQSLTLSHFGLGPESGRALKNLLTYSTSLQTLDISYNDFGNDGIEKIAEGLRHNTELKTLNMDVNYGALPETEDKLVKAALAHPQLRYLRATLFMSLEEQPFNTNSVLTLIPFSPAVATFDHDKAVTTMLQLFTTILKSSRSAQTAAILAFRDELKKQTENGVYPQDPSFGFDLPARNIDEALAPLLQLPKAFTENLKSIRLNTDKYTVRFDKNLLPALQTLQSPARKRFQARDLANETSGNAPKPF